MKLELPGDSPLQAVAAHSSTLVIFLRSFGCTFCREAMADVSRIQTDIRQAGAGIVFVHAESPEVAAPWFAKYGLSAVTTISDPDLAHYKAFGLGRTSPASMVDPKVWMRGAACALSHGFGSQSYEMMRQLPGVFIVQGREVLAEYRHSSPADRPNYLSILRSAIATQSAIPNPQSTI